MAECEELTPDADRYYDGADSIPTYHFSNPDPYAKCQPLPDDHPKHNAWFGEDGHLHVKNLSGYWLPDIRFEKEIGGTIYSVSGTYEGTETVDKKIERIMLHDLKNKEESAVAQPKKDTEMSRATDKITAL